MDQSRIIERLNQAEQRIRALLEGRQTGYFTANSPFHPFTTPLTSTDWDGDARSTEAKTLLDLSAVFTNAAGERVPGGAKAVLARIIARDSGSAGSVSAYFALSPNDVAASHTVAARPAGRANDAPDEQTNLVPCNVDGDIYYQIGATGAGTMDCWIEIWGYVQ